MLLRVGRLKELQPIEDDHSLVIKQFLNVRMYKTEYKKNTYVIIYIYIYV